jgi:hypothetical protein
MTNNTKMFLGCGGVTALALVVAIACSALFIGYKGYSLYKDNDEAGRSFGATNDQGGCLKEGLRRGQFNSDSKVDQFSLGTFVQGCLEVAQEVADFCVGVPDLLDTEAQHKWTRIECEKIGQSDNPGCRRVYNEKHTYCGFPKP